MPHDEASILKRTTATGVSAATRRLGYFAVRGRFQMSCHHPPHWGRSKYGAWRVLLKGNIAGTDPRNPDSTGAYSQNKNGHYWEVPVDHAYSALGRVWFRCAESSILGTFRRSVVTLGKRYADRKNGVCSVLHTFRPHSHVTGAPKHDGVTSRNPPASADGRRNPSQDMGVF